MNVVEQDKPELYIRKPFDSDHLLAKIGEILKVSDSKRDATKQRLSDEDAKWMEHYVPGMGKVKESGT
jgi:hypothetical protein